MSSVNTFCVVQVKSDLTFIISKIYSHQELCVYQPRCHTVIIWQGNET